MDAHVADHNPMPSRTMPGPSIFGSISALPAFRRDPLATMTGWFARYGDAVRVGAWPRVIHLLVHPDHVEQVLLAQHRNYSKKMIGYRKLALVLGNGLVTSEGDEWRMHRRTIQPAFHKNKIASFAEQMVDSAEAMLARWDESNEAELDVGEEMMRLTFHVVGATLMSTDTYALDDRSIGAEVTEVMKYLSDRMMRAIEWPDWIPTPGNMRFRRALAHFDGLISEAIRERIAVEQRPNDLMTMLIEARDPETGAGFTEKEIRDEVVTIMGAGHETTANALAWTWHLLAANPEIEERLHFEIERALAGRRAQFDDLPLLGYVQCVLQESMRLYPPVWGIGRAALVPQSIGDWKIPRGATILLSPYLTHRHPEFWDEPEAFRPERFENGNQARMARFQYFPFGGGPRTCIGNHFAMMEATLLLTTIAQRYRLSPMIEPSREVSITLRPRQLIMKRERR